MPTHFPHFQIHGSADSGVLGLLDQTALPFQRVELRVSSLAACAHAIRTMQVRGAPLIGATAAFGMAFAMREDASDVGLAQAAAVLAATRPTAVNLHWAIAKLVDVLNSLSPDQRPVAGWDAAVAIAAEDAAANAQIGQYGLQLLQALPRRADQPLRVMTHCNAGWLACTAHGTALSPMYAAHEAGLPISVWVSETRPRNQGLLTAWELNESGVAHQLIADNAAGILLLNGDVDAVIVGADRIARNGDTANKVGTVLKALAAEAAGVPFYIAAPRSTIDFACPSGADIPIEERDGDELRCLSGINQSDAKQEIRQYPAGRPVANPAFDVTPARYIRGIITEHGVFAPHELGALA